MLSFMAAQPPLENRGAGKIVSHFYPSFSDSEEQTDGSVPTYIHTHSNTPQEQASFVHYVSMSQSSGLKERVLFRDPAQVKIGAI